jgi:hypothetical protein
MKNSTYLSKLRKLKIRSRKNKRKEARERQNKKTNKSTCLESKHLRIPTFQDGISRSL